MEPVLVIFIVFAFIAFKKYLDYRERVEAIQSGIDPRTLKEVEEEEKDKPSVARERVRPVRDHRLASMVWIALGIAFMVAGFMSAGMTKGVEKGIAFGIWGLVPLAIGIGRYAYHASRKEGEADCYLRSAFTLIAIGLAFIVCVTLSTGMIKGAERAMAVGVWGLIPLAIGMVMYIYGGMVRRERLDQDE